MSGAHRYLGLDLAKRTGYCLAEGDQCLRSGVRDFSGTDDLGRRGIMLYNFLISLGRVEEIYYESNPFGGNFKKKDGSWGTASKDGREFLHGMLMVVRMYASGFGAYVIPVNTSTLKKEFTGDGRAEKEDMCRAARSLGWKGGEDGTSLHHDEADGIALVATQIRKRYGLILRF
jgi:hypothetical protein